MHRTPSTSPKPSRSRLAAKPTPAEVAPLLVYLTTERGLAKNSVDAYRRDLSDLGEHLEKQAKSLLNATADDFRFYLQAQSRLDKSTKTVARRLAAIRTYLKFCEIMGNDRKATLDQLERPKPESDLPKILSEELVVRLISAPDPKHRLFTRDVAMLELLYASGLRASELCTLSVRDVNLSVGAVRVFGKGSKERIVPVGKAAIDAIQRYLTETRPTLLRDASERLFLSRSGKPMERIGLWMLVKKFADKAELNKFVSPHVLRHCFASHLLGGGADLRVVQELLGHSDVATTQIYTHVDTKRLLSVHKQFHPRG